MMLFIGFFRCFMMLFIYFVFDEVWVKKIWCFFCGGSGGIFLSICLWKVFYYVFFVVVVFMNL